MVVKIPKEIVDKYTVVDNDTWIVCQEFEAKSGAKVLEVGANEEAIANMLADCGFNVIGVDLQKYHSAEPFAEPPPLNYAYLRHDFCNLSLEFIKEHQGTFDAVISISAIEHFGLGAYKEGFGIHPFYDVIAMRIIWQMLKEGGVAYITVPYSSNPAIWDSSTRLYNLSEINDRLIQDFSIELLSLVLVDKLKIKGVEYSPNNGPSLQELFEYDGEIPHITAFLKLRKVPVNRIAPG